MRTVFAGVLAGLLASSPSFAGWYLLNRNTHECLPIDVISDRTNVTTPLQYRDIVENLGGDVEDITPDYLRRRAYVYQVQMGNMSGPRIMYFFDTSKLCQAAAEVP